jgi:hypothetical protein
MINFFWLRQPQLEIWRLRRVNQLLQRIGEPLLEEVMVFLFESILSQRLGFPRPRYLRGVTLVS